MITITDGLYAHRAGGTLIITDQPNLPRATEAQPRILIIAEDHAPVKRRLRQWLATRQLDDIAEAINISRSTAHRLRAAMGVTKRDSYTK